MSPSSVRSPNTFLPLTFSNSFQFVSEPIYAFKSPIKILRLKLRMPSVTAEGPGSMIENVRIGLSQNERIFFVTSASSS